MTPQKAKLGPDNNTTAYIYAVKLKIGPRFGVLKLKIGPSMKLKAGPIFDCFPNVYSFFWACLKFFKAQLVSHCAK